MNRKGGECRSLGCWDSQKDGRHRGSQPTIRRKGLMEEVGARRLVAGVVTVLREVTVLASEDKE